MTTRADLDHDLTDVQRERLSRDRQRQRRALVGAMVVPPLIVVVSMLTVRATRADGPTSSPTVWGAVGLGLAWMALAGLVGLRRREQSPSERRLVLSGDRPTIRRVRRSLQRSQPIADDDVEVARAVALTVQDTRWSSVLPPLGISAALLLPLLLPRDAGDALAGWEVVLRLAVGLVLVVSAVVAEVARRLVLRGAERARIWLVRRETPEVTL